MEKGLNAVDFENSATETKKLVPNPEKVFFRNTLVENEVESRLTLTSRKGSESLISLSMANLMELC